LQDYLENITTPILRNDIKQLLVCPITKQHLLPVNRRLKEILDAAMHDDVLQYADGESVVGEGLTFLVTQNGTTVYSVIGGVPILLELKQVLVPEKNR
jgi:uncharacterized protein YbaR (Trm112 family)